MSRVRYLLHPLPLPVAAEDADRDIHQEYGAPGEELYEDAAESVACNRPRVDRDLVYPNPFPKLAPCEGVCDDGDAVHEKEGRSNPLDQPEGEKHIGHHGAAGE